MNETSLAEVVRELDRTAGSIEPDVDRSAPLPAEPCRDTAILDGLRSTDRLLAELRGRYRDLRIHRSRLVARLRQMEADRRGEDAAPRAVAV